MTKPPDYESNEPSQSTESTLDEAVRALRPSEERGGSVLVVGATTALRAERVRSLLDRVALEGSGEGLAPPLLVRVHAEVAARARDGRSLHDEASAAVEEALDAEGAPGALPAGPDEPGSPALGAMGGWLFRARSAGRRGIVLVLDDADAWIDGRGLSPSPDARRSALAWLDELLDECDRCAVSVLVSTRAADEAGSPAIPGPVVGRFATVLHLGGAPVVTRDPRALVPRLEGRSFTLRALERALAGWLELASSDRDTVVHFAVPPVIPLVIPTPEAAEPDELLRAEDGNEDRISAVLPVQPPAVARSERGEASASAREPAAPTVSPANEPPVTERTADVWREGVRAALAMREVLAAWRALPQPVRGVARLERAFVDVVSKLPLSLEALSEGERATGLESTRLRTEGERVLRAFEESFSEQYAAEWERWLAGAQRPKMLVDLPGMLAHATVERDALGSALIVCTGLRLDAWRSLRTALLAKLPTLTPVENGEGVLWSARPATPAVQRELLARGLGALANALPPRDEPSAPRTLAEAARPRREHLGRVELLRVDAYATAMTRAEKKRPSLREVLQVGERYALEGIVEVCRSLSENAVVAIAGDAGLAPAHQQHHHQQGRAAGATPPGAAVSGYAFGADAPPCVVVPYALLHWAGSAPTGRRTRRKP